ncbi:T9SS type A sorting domain-containing protein [candidate division KSB1 bacterium]|nr:T9SS type A sorting domain-containing protein [candidate division KSB1 bacterium]
MKQWFGLKTLAFGLAFTAAVALNSFAQGDQNQHQNQHGAWPDELQEVTLEGTVIIDSSHVNVYFLDIDNDGVADYHLMFGPDWYQPESGAVRPEDGASVAIVGALHDRADVPQVIIFELDGLVWRDAVENWWGNDEWPENPEIVSLSGTVLVDTTYFYLHYYLDVDGDNAPDYHLSFGPPWYENADSVILPVEGETVNITGVLRGSNELPCVEVFTINDETWREPTGPAPWAGMWIHKEDQQKRRVHSSVDTCSWLEVPPGAMKMSGGQHGGREFPDSIFCKFHEVYCDSLPGAADSLQRGWRIHFSDPNGQSMHGNGAGLQFMKQVRMQLQFKNADDDGSLTKATADAPELYAWNETSQTWLPVADAMYDPISGSFSLEPEAVEVYYAVFESTNIPTSVTSNTVMTPATAELGQNYPNPFNPETTIRFDLTSPSRVILTVYNSLGQQVTTLVNGQAASGVHQVTWDGTNNIGQIVPSGVYYYRLTLDNGQTQTRKMMFLK